MSLLNLSPAEFCEATKACEQGRTFALTHSTMADVWDNCPKVDWLLWIAEKASPLAEDRTLRLFAVCCARNTPLGGGLKTGDLLTNPRSLTALEVAERFAHGNATSEELFAAEAAAWAATPSSARSAAEAAMRAAAWSATEDAMRAAAQSAAEAAALTAAWAAARAAQAAYLRTLIPNPFRKEAQP